MRKYGKYEKRPEAVPAKQPKVKNLLLQTYFTSLLCLVLCVTMFFGTSYAWFTAEVENVGNEIYIGTLDVELEKKVPVTEKNPDGWASLSETNKEGNNTTQLFDKNIRWEPGYTTLETVKITNKGDLAFNYGLTFTDGKIDGTANDELLKKVAQYFEVYVHAGDYAEGEEQPKSFVQIKESSRWSPVLMDKEVATLADILEKGLPVFSGSMENVVKTYGSADPAASAGPSLNDSNPEQAVYIIALHMKEDAGNKFANETGKDNDLTAQQLMGKKITLNVKLTAYQRTYEQDAFGTTYYDSLEAFAQSLAEIEAVDPMSITYTGLEQLGSGDSNDTTLDAVYAFKPQHDQLAKCAYQFQNFVADFVVYANQPIPADTLLLAGLYPQLSKDWIALTVDGELKAETPLRLVNSISSKLRVSYTDLCEIASSSDSFLCGVKYLGTAADPINVTVELRLYKLDASGTPTTEFVVVSAQQFTVPATK